MESFPLPNAKRQAFVMEKTQGISGGLPSLCLSQLPLDQLFTGRIYGNLEIKPLHVWVYHWFLPVMGPPLTSSNLSQSPKLWLWRLCCRLAGFGGALWICLSLQISGDTLQTQFSHRPLKIQFVQLFPVLRLRTMTSKILRCSCPSSIFLGILIPAWNCVLCLMLYSFAVCSPHQSISFRNFVYVLPLILTPRRELGDQYQTPADSGC